MLVPGKQWVGVVLSALLAGCGRAPAPPVGTGAREAAQEFFEGLVRQDWQQAYLALHPDGKNRLTRPEFTRLAEAYRRKLGFSPEELHVQSCDENGTEAIAHVVLTGHVESKQRRYKDAVVLRRAADGWRVVLPDNFGRSVGRPAR